MKALILSSALRGTAGLVPVIVGGCMLVLSCSDGGGVGDPCIPEDEYRTAFSGFSEQQVSAESRSFQCETRTCLVSHFRGRVSCPYGQSAGEARCAIPGALETTVTAHVPAQLEERRPDDAVYCSCRCDGPDPAAPYCECPSGFSCEPLIPQVTADARQLAGSYCVKDGTHVTEAVQIPQMPCDESRMTCGAARPYEY